LKYDNVMNDQRKVVFEQRIELMRDADVSETVADMRHSVIGDLVTKHIPEAAYPEQWDAKGLREEVKNLFGLDLAVDEWAKEEGIADEEVRERIVRAADETMAGKVAKYGAEIMRYVEKSILLQTLDHLWREHLVMLEHLRHVIGFRGYAQRDPLNEYKSEAFTLFDALLTKLREAVTGQLLRIEIVTQAPPTAGELPAMEAHHFNPVTGEDELALASTAVAADGGRTPARERIAKDPATWGKVGRNEPCPCGSGKKYKHCHGRYA
jgi:preprotein translocase subunit SecA